MDRELRAALGRLEIWSRIVLGRPLRPYQAEPAAAILRSIASGRGDAITVMMSRQAGKNELSAHLESFLLANHQHRPVTLVKAAPTFKPQTITSLLRLTAALENPLTAGRWRGERGYMIRLGQARIFFFSAEPGARVVGATASLLLEIDEAQDVSAAKHDKDFAPMAAAANATRVYWGTAWDETTLLQRQIEANLAAERRDGIRRHFAYPWWVVAEHNPAYGRYVEGERARLGADHPLFKTQYELVPIAGAAGFFSPAQRALLAGSHPRRTAAADGVYVAGLDVAGGAEEDPTRLSSGAGRDADATVLLVARLEQGGMAGVAGAPLLLIEGAYAWRGASLHTQYATLLGLLRDTWRVRRVVVDATGLGRGLADFLTAALAPGVVVPFVFSAASKSNLGYDLLAAVSAGRVRWYADEDGEAREFWRQVAEARYETSPGGLLRWGVPAWRGHDDYLSALGLLVAAAREVPPAPAAAIVPAVDRDEEYSRSPGGFA